MKNLVRNILLIALIASICIWTFHYALAQECPPNTTCKTIVVTAEQESTLNQLIENTCLQGPYAQIHQVVGFYKELLAKAPVVEPPKPVAPPKPAAR